MAKFTALLAAIAILFLVAVDASIYRTTVTTTTIEEPENPGRTSQRCRQQMQRADLNQCRQYMQQSGRMTEEIVMPAAGNPMQHRQQCCQQLRQIEDNQCRCEALQEMAREMMQQQGQMEGQQEMREIMQRAQSLASSCGLGGCEISQGGWF